MESINQSSSNHVAAVTVNKNSNGLQNQDNIAPKVASVPLSDLGNEHIDTTAKGGSQKRSTLRMGLRDPICNDCGLGMPDAATFGNNNTVLFLMIIAVLVVRFRFFPRLKAKNPFRSKNMISKAKLLFLSKPQKENGPNENLLSVIPGKLPPDGETNSCSFSGDGEGSNHEDNDKLVERQSEKLRGAQWQSKKAEKLNDTCSRALSAYKIFFLEQREKIMQEMVSKTLSGADTAQETFSCYDITMEVSRRWEALHPEKRAEYDVLAEEERNCRKEVNGTQLRPQSPSEFVNSSIGANVLDQKKKEFEYKKLGHIAGCNSTHTSPGIDHQLRVNQMRQRRKMIQEMLTSDLKFKPPPNLRKRERDDSRRSEAKFVKTGYRQRKAAENMMWNSSIGANVFDQKKKKFEYKKFGHIAGFNSSHISPGIDRQLQRNHSNPFVAGVSVVKSSYPSVAINQDGGMRRIGHEPDLETKLDVLFAHDKADRMKCVQECIVTAQLTKAYRKPEYSNLRSAMEKRIREIANRSELLAWQYEYLEKLETNKQLEYVENCKSIEELRLFYGSNKFYHLRQAMTKRVEILKRR